MGLVLVAQDAQTGRDVAVKLIHQAILGDANVRARFDREMTLLRRVNHPNIANLLDHGHHGDVPFTVMELVPGNDLRMVLNGEGALEPLDAAHIIVQIARALGEVHGNNIVHRDLKPANIVVEKTNNGIEVNVLDFGVAKSLDTKDAPLTKTGHMIGTGGYMAPELITGARSPTPSSDVYACGVLFLEMLLGRPLFSGNPNPFSALTMQVKLGVQIPRRLAGNPVGAVLRRCTMPNPDARYPDGKALEKAITAVMTDAANLGRFTAAEADAYFQEFYPSALSDDVLSSGIISGEFDTPTVNDVEPSPQPTAFSQHQGPLVPAAIPGRSQAFPAGATQQTARPSGGDRGLGKAVAGLAAVLLLTAIGGAVYVTLQAAPEPVVEAEVEEPEAPPDEIDIDLDEVKLYILSNEGMQSVSSVRNIPAQNRGLVIIQSEYDLPESEFYVADLSGGLRGELTARRMTAKEVEKRALTLWRASLLADEAADQAEYVSAEIVEARQRSRRRSKGNKGTRSQRSASQRTHRAKPKIRVISNASFPQPRKKKKRRRYRRRPSQY